MEMAYKISPIITSCPQKKRMNIGEEKNRRKMKSLGVIWSISRELERRGQLVMAISNWIFKPSSMKSRNSLDILINIKIRLEIGLTWNTLRVKPWLQNVKDFHVWYLILKIGILVFSSGKAISFGLLKWHS